MKFNFTNLCLFIVFIINASYALNTMTISKTVSTRSTTSSITKSKLPPVNLGVANSITTCYPPKGMPWEERASSLMNPPRTVGDYTLYTILGGMTICHIYTRPYPIKTKYYFTTTTSSLVPIGKYITYSAVCDSTKTIYSTYKTTDYSLKDVKTSIPYEVTLTRRDQNIDLDITCSTSKRINTKIPYIETVTTQGKATTKIWKATTIKSVNEYTTSYSKGTNPYWLTYYYSVEYQESYTSGYEVITSCSINPKTIDDNIIITPIPTPTPTPSTVEIPTPTDDENTEITDIPQSSIPTDIPTNISSITTTTTKQLPNITTTITTTTKQPPAITTTTTTTTNNKFKSTKCLPVYVTITEKENVTVTEKETVTVTITKSQSSTPNNSNCAKKYAQCGGIGFNGPTCCDAGSVCKKIDQYYHQCI